LARGEPAERRVLSYFDAGLGSFFQYPESFTRDAAEFLASGSAFAPY
jgi:hypothetical protein